jgi:vancomycin resistance protein YoaR
MNSETANYFSEVLESLADAEVQFKFNQDNMIMNGYPIRIIDQCREKLKRLEDLELPDAASHPKLHAYMARLHAARDARAEEQRKRNEYLQSPEGRRVERQKQIEELRGSLRDFERHYMVCVSEAANYTVKAENAKKRIELTKSILSDLEAQGI